VLRQLLVSRIKSISDGSAGSGTQDPTWQTARASSHWTFDAKRAN
jgi:hypothetical protein